MIFAYVIIRSTGLSHLDRRINRSCSLFTGTHGQNDRGSTGDSVAAGIDHRAARQAVGTVGDQAAVLVGVQTRRGGADQRVRAGAQRHDHRINVQNELSALLDDGVAAAGRIRLTQFHFDAGHTLDPAVLVAQHLGGVRQRLKDDALLLGVLDLLLTGRQLGHAAAVDDVHILGTQTLRAAGGVHGDIAAADNGDGLTLHDGRAGILLVRLHQIDSGQVLVGRVDAVQALAGDAHKAGQTELGDAVHQNAARNVQGFVDGDLVAQLCQVARDGQAGGASADDSDLVAIGRGGGGLGMYVVAVPVGNKALQAANADGLALDAADALAFTLVLLRADTAADGGQRAGLRNDVVGGLKVALGDVLDEAGNGCKVRLRWGSAPAV